MATAIFPTEHGLQELSPSIQLDSAFITYLKNVERMYDSKVRS